MMMVTVNDIMAMGPYAGYPRARIEALWAGREALTAREVRDLDIPAKDRIWVLLRLLSPRGMVRAALDFAVRVEPIFAAAQPGDTHVADCNALTARWLAGEPVSREELRAWAAAAWAAWAADAAEVREWQLDKVVDLIEAGE